jgi:hypothetical protein
VVSFYQRRHIYHTITILKTSSVVDSKMALLVQNICFYSSVEIRVVVLEFMLIQICYMITACISLEKVYFSEFVVLELDPTQSKVDILHVDPSLVVL